MYSGDDDGDFMALLRSNSRQIKGKGIARMPPSASDPLLCLPPPPPPLFPVEMEESLTTIFPDHFATNQMMFRGLEDICLPLLHPPQPQPPQPNPQSQPQQQTGLFQTLLASAGVVGPTTMMVSEPLRNQSSLKQTRKLQSLAMKRKCENRKVEKKRVVRLSADIMVLNDNWAWRKYGQKPIKGSSYPRSYYKCNTCKSCPVKKMVDKSPWDPKMFAITYIGEHNHLLPTHCNCAAGNTHNKYSDSFSGNKKLDNREGMSTGLSPMTSLVTPPLMEEDGEEAILYIEDMEVVSDDELVFLGGAPLKTHVAAGSSLLFNKAEDLFPSQMWDNDNIFFNDNDGGAATGGGHGGAN